MLFVTARGLTTGAMPYRDRALQIDFDFCAHELVLRTSDAREQRIALAPMATRGFLRRRDGGAARARCRCAHLDHAGGDRGRDPVRPGSRARELRRAAANAFWRQLVQADRVFNIFRARFLGKVSPVHFFWGSFDLAVTRFSGRAAPPLKSNNTPNVAAWVMNEAYSHECSSVGFWPGNGGYGRAAFYA